MITALPTMIQFLLLTFLTLPTPPANFETSLDEVLKLARTAPMKAIEICEKETKGIDTDKAGVETAKKLEFLARYYAKSEKNALADGRVLKAKAIAKRLNERDLLRKIYQIEAVIASHKGEFKRGVDASTNSISLTKPSSPYMAIPLAERGICRMQLGEYALALGDLQKSFEIAADAENHRLVLHCQVNMANAYDAMNQHDRAIEIYESSLKIAEDPKLFKSKNRRLLATIHVNIGNSVINKMKSVKEFDNAKTVRATKHFQAAKDIAGKSIQDVVAIAETGLGDIAYLKTDFTEASARYESATKIYAKLLDVLGLAQISSRMSKLNGGLDIDVLERQVESQLLVIADAKASGQYLMELDLIDSLISLIEDGGSKNNRNKWNGDEQLLLDLLARKTEIGELRLKKNSAEALRRADESIKLIEQKYAYDALERASQYAERGLAEERQRNLLLSLMCVGLVLGCLSLGTLWRAKVLVSRKLDKANQRQLVEQRNQAAIEKVGAQQEKLDSLSTMCAGVMHDFNNYLLAIIAEAEHGAVQAAPQQSSRSFRNIMDSAELASGLTKDLSNYIGAGKMSFSSRDLNQELLNALPILQSISNNRIRLKTDDVSIPVAVDSAAFRNVMINLVKNAVEASSDDQEIIVSTRLEKASKMGGLSIIDSGVGMSRESIDKVFDPFFTSKGLGRGLGLPSAKGIVESHGGEMQIIPRSTNGTKVDVLLPVTDSPVSTAIDLDSANKLSYVKYSIPSTVVESSSTSDCRTILFVDDDEMVRRAISSILGTRYETSMASSAEEALIALSIPENNITCVITDYSLPGSSGVELAEEVSHRFSGIPVILISGFPEKNVAESNFISEFLPKPFTRNALLSAIDKAMDGKKTLDFTR